jgi:hypothetical protein
MLLIFGRVWITSWGNRIRIADTTTLVMYSDFTTTKVLHDFLSPGFGLHLGIMVGTGAPCTRPFHIPSASRDWHDVPII